MSPNTSIPAGAPCWADLLTSDPEKIERFYGQVFGWTAYHTSEEYGGYINFQLNGLPVAGCMANDGESGASDGWTVYLATADAQATSKAVAEHGGTVYLPSTQVGDQGSMAVVADAGGATVGAWQPAAHAGFGLLDAPGTPAWFELHTRDYAPTVQFYKDAFEWDAHVASDSDDFRYTTLGQGESMRAGIMDVSAMPAEHFPVGWSIYFGVEDADAVAAEADRLGGSVVQPVEDTPYGRLATFADPTGSLFKIRQSPS